MLPLEKNDLRNILNYLKYNEIKTLELDPDSLTKEQALEISKALYRNTSLDETSRENVKKVINFVLGEDYLALHKATENGDFAEVERLISQGFNVDQESRSGATPLYVALKNNHIDLAKRLIELGANINHQFENGENLLWLAIFDGHTEVVKKLIELGTNVNQVVVFLNALHFAASLGRTDVLEVLVKNGIDVNRTSQSGFTPVHYAFTNNKIESVEKLISLGATADQNIVYYLEYVKNQEKARTTTYTTNFVERKYYSKSADPLEGDIDQEMVQEMADQEITLLHVASYYNKLEAVKKIIAKRIDIDQKTKTEAGFTALYIAAQNGHLEVVKELIKANANVNLGTDDDGTTPAWIAACNGHFDILVELIKANADIDQPRADGQTPLDIAILKGHQIIIELLKSTKVEISLKESDPQNGLLPQEISEDETQSSTQISPQFEGQTQTILLKITDLEKKQWELIEQINLLKTTKTSNTEAQLKQEELTTIRLDLSRLNEDLKTLESTKNIAQNLQHKFKEAQLKGGFLYGDDAKNRLYLSGSGADEYDREQIADQIAKIKSDPQKARLYTDLQLQINSIIRAIQNASITNASFNISAKRKIYNFTQNIIGSAPFGNFANCVIDALITMVDEKDFEAKCHKIAKLAGDGGASIDLLSEELARKMVMDEEILDNIQKIINHQADLEQSNPIHKLIGGIKKQIPNIQEQLAKNKLAGISEPAYLMTTMLLGTIFNDQKHFNEKVEINTQLASRLVAQLKEVTIEVKNNLPKIRQAPKKVGSKIASLRSKFDPSITSEAPQKKQPFVMDWDEDEEVKKDPSILSTQVKRLETEVETIKISIERLTRQSPQTAPKSPEASARISGSRLKPPIPEMDLPK
ncbi:MAG: ankyrin repeat domain-containing protein [Pseudomonadota bacterium]